MDVVFDDERGTATVFVAFDGSGLAYTVCERVFLVVERVTAGLLSV